MDARRAIVAAAAAAVAGVEEVSAGGGEAVEAEAVVAIIRGTVPNAACSI